MQFISVRDFREKSAQIWEGLNTEQDMVVTSNGKPIAILSSVLGGNFEEALSAIRSARGMLAIQEMQKKSIEIGNDKMTANEINAEIKQARKNRKKQ